MERRNRRIENGGAVRKKVREENCRGDKGAAGGEGHRRGRKWSRGRKEREKNCR